MGRMVPYGGSLHDIEELAASLRSIAERKIGKKCVRARELLEWMVEKLRGRIEVARDADNLEREGGSLVIDPRGEFVIRLSPYTSRLRDNFTLAHELGHYFLHYDADSSPNDRTVVFGRHGSGTSETEADAFAAALLMPREEFTRVYNEFRGIASAVAGHFEVSEAAVWVRASKILPRQG